MTKGEFPCKIIACSNAECCSLARLCELPSVGRQPPSRVVVEVHAGSFGGQRKPGRGPSCRLCMFPTTAFWLSWQRPKTKGRFLLAQTSGQMFPEGMQKRMTSITQSSQGSSSPQSQTRSHRVWLRHLSREGRRDTNSTWGYSNLAVPN